MPGSRCAVATCNNNWHTRVVPDSDRVIYFHRFPQNEEFRKIWVNRCKRADTNLNTKNARICSIHFTPDDYLHEKITKIKTKVM